MRVLWSPAARQELASVKTYIAQDDLGAAQAVERRILERVSKLATTPQAGRPGRVAGTRELSIPDVRYLVIYEVTAAEILILRLRHARQLWPPKDP